MIKLGNIDIKSIFLGDKLISKVMLNGENLIEKPEPDYYYYQVATTLSELSTDDNIFYAYTYDNSKWNALNTDNQYEQWGIIEETDDINSISKYDGKLAILNGDTKYEYQYSNGQWNYLGEKEDVDFNYEIKGNETVTQKFPLKNFRLTYSSTGAKNFTITSTTSDYSRLVVQKTIISLNVTLYDNNGRSYNGNVKTITARKDFEVTFNELDDAAVIVSYAITGTSATSSTVTYSVNTAIYPKQYDESIFNDYSLYQGYPYNSLDDIEIMGKGVIYNIDGYLYKDKERTTVNPYNLTNVYGKYNTLRGVPLTEIKLLDENIDVIGNDAFYGCTNLTSVTLPDSVTSIGNNAFYLCSSLTTITYNGTMEQWNAITKGSNWHYNAPPIYVTCSDGVINIAKYLNTYSDGTQKYENIISDKETLVSTVIQDSVTSIEYNTFQNCTSLTSVTIPNSVTSIGNYAFQNCTSLTSIEIPDSVTSIGNYTFIGCSSLTSVTIGNSVTSIGEQVFKNCSGLTSVTIGNSVTSIGVQAFYLCSSLTSIEIPNSVTTIGDGAFYLCSGLTNVVIPDSVTSIGNEAFIGCRSLASVTIGNSVTRIGEHAFQNCTSLTSVTIGNSVTTIGVSAFNYVPSTGTLTCYKDWYNNLSSANILSLGDVYNWTKEWLDNEIGGIEEF